MMVAAVRWDGREIEEASTMLQLASWRNIRQFSYVGCFAKYSQQLSSLQNIPQYTSRPFCKIFHPVGACFFTKYFTILQLTSLPNIPQYYSGQSCTISHETYTMQNIQQYLFFLLLVCYISIPGQYKLFREIDCDLFLRVYKVIINKLLLFSG